MRFARALQLALFVLILHMQGYYYRVMVYRHSPLPALVFYSVRCRCVGLRLLVRRHRMSVASNECRCR